MPPRANRAERSAAEQLLTTFGLRRHPDPFAHLAGDGKSGSDWFQARVAQGFEVCESMLREAITMGS
jgi:hypothetical protein